MAPESVADTNAFTPLIDFLVQHKVYANPTLFLFWGGGTERWRDWTRDGATLAADPNLAFVPAEVRAAWNRQPRVRDGYKNTATFLRMYSEAGGKILAATDAVCGGCNQIVPGLSLHQFDTANPHIAEGLIWASLCAAVLKRFLAHAAQRVGRTAISTRRVAMCAHHILDALVATLLLGGRSSRDASTRADLSPGERTTRQPG